MPQYSPAEFKTIHERLGVSAKLIADKAGLSTGRIWEYESPDRRVPVPEHASTVLAEMAAAFDGAVENLVAQVKSDKRGAIPRHADPAAFEALNPELKGFGPLTHGLVIAEVQRRLQRPVDYV